MVITKGGEVLSAGKSTADGTWVNPGSSGRLQNFLISFFAKHKKASTKLAV